MNARNRVFMILGLLTLGSLIWYLLTARAPSDLRLIGTVDANEVLVSAKIPGRVQALNVEEGQAVKTGELIAREITQLAQSCAQHHRHAITRNVQDRKRTRIVRDGMFKDDARCREIRIVSGDLCHVRTSKNSVSKCPRPQKQQI